MQPQGHVQIILNLIDYDMGLQAAGDAPRWEHRGGCEPTDPLEGGECDEDVGNVHLESGFPVETRDRKSTRLNSSHRCISSAVFCLKKKNTKTLSATLNYILHVSIRSFPVMIV